MNQLSVNQLFHSYGDGFVLSDISFQVSSGDVACLVGPSGCGKTTLLKILAGIETCQKGNILWGDVDISYMPIEKRRVGLVFQQPGLFPHMTALENVSFAVQKSNQTNAEQIALGYLKQMGLADRANAMPHQLSAGQQQRVAIARALANNPYILLMDEPFANLDAVLRRELRVEIVSILKRMSIPTVIVTHDPQEAAELADTIHVMERGRFVQSGNSKALYEKPVSLFVAKMFGIINTIPLSRSEKDSNKVSSPFGAHVLPDDLHGQDVELCVRAEDIIVTKNETADSIVAEVQAVRESGRSKNIYLRLLNSDVTLVSVNYDDVELSHQLFVAVRNVMFFPASDVKEVS